MEKTKILIVDDHTAIRNELKAQLETQDDLDIVGEASNGLEAISKSEELHPDIILMDIAMPELNGLKATRIITKKFPEIKVIILTIYPNEEYIMESFKNGAKGYLLKDSKDLLHAIHTINKGERYFKPTITKILRNEIKSNPENNPID